MHARAEGSFMSICSWEHLYYGQEGRGGSILLHLRLKEIDKKKSLVEGKTIDDDHLYQSRTPTWSRPLSKSSSKKKPVHIWLPSY
jgi:hypothetical protein